ncbi:ArsR/SmtB family transcription factor [Tsukamurella soli]|uniref:HTH arsR-type domain-containing protein n=1 Tax=Tsukamurella soli TaxID=644556 RepID=A0ABP8KAL2_9ACTN
MNIKPERNGFIPMSTTSATPATPAAPERAESGPTQATVRGLQAVLAALADPVRLEMVRRLHSAGGPVACAQLYEGVTKATASHHFKILREAGITDRETRGGVTYQRLRVDRVEAAYPGLLGAIVAAADGER